MYFRKEVMQRVYERRKKEEEEKAKSEPSYCIFSSSKSEQKNKKNDNMNDSSHMVQFKLKEVFVKHGYSIIDDPKRLIAMILDLCSLSDVELNVLKTMINTKKVQDCIRKGEFDNDDQKRAVYYFEQTYGMSDKWAQEGVSWIAYALDCETSSLQLKPKGLYALCFDGLYYYRQGNHFDCFRFYPDGRVVKTFTKLDSLDKINSVAKWLNWNNMNAGVDKAYYSISDNSLLSFSKLISIGPHYYYHYFEGEGLVRDMCIYLVNQKPAAKNGFEIVLDFYPTD